MMMARAGDEVTTRGEFNEAALVLAARLEVSWSGIVCEHWKVESFEEALKLVEEAESFEAALKLVEAGLTWKVE